MQGPNEIDRSVTGKQPVSAVQLPFKVDQIAQGRGPQTIRSTNHAAVRFAVIDTDRDHVVFVPADQRRRNRIFSRRKPCVFVFRWKRASVANLAAVVILFGLAAGNLVRLLRDYKNHVPGSKLKARMVGMFVGLVVLPLIVVF